MAVGCGNWITEVPLYEIESLGIVSKCRNGIRSFRPLDKNRDGFITGEGGAALLLEAADIAQQRGAPIFGKIRGLGNCIEFSSRKGFTVPEIVTKRCMETALRDAGSRADDLACIIPHGSGTQKGDRSELRSIADLLGQKRSEVPMTGMKAYTGHLGAASDIAEIIFGVLSLKRNIVPATLNFSETDREFSDLRISSLHQLCGRDLFLSASYGVGGQSSSVVVEVL
jgi:3-oxoacyl-[acyl-carrier-protein] synthase II